METYISLLRGINVGAQKKILMKDLKALYEALGFEKVQTYIQSGNVLFQTKKQDKEMLSRKVEKKIKEVYGFDVALLHLTIPDMEKIIAANPYLASEKIQSLYVAFLYAIPETAKMELLKKIDLTPDQYSISDKAIYMCYDTSYGTSKMNNNFFETKLKLTATTRNWKTTIKLKELAEAL
ncbi:MAG TPA: DUF1697 domain-containing protein [Flavipsychrobacter sp.]|nr:DUF1697 domain-containing protein [Flavipsychrobacter sp.]